MDSTAIEGQGQLNPESSLPEERAERNLVPKSYAEAMNEPNDQNGARVDSVHAGAEKGTVIGSTNVSSMNGHKNKQKFARDNVVYDNHINETGEFLTSIKPKDTYEQSLQHNGETGPREKHHELLVKRQDELASGRKAGEGWEKSAFVSRSAIACNLWLTRPYLAYDGHRSTCLYSEEFRRWPSSGTRFPFLCSYPSFSSLLPSHSHGLSSYRILFTLS